MPVPAGWQLEKAGAGRWWRGLAGRIIRSRRCSVEAVPRFRPQTGRYTAGRELPVLPFQRRGRGIFGGANVLASRCNLFICRVKTKPPDKRVFIRRFGLMRFWFQRL
jgi:hypothetical protein